MSQIPQRHFPKHRSSQQGKTWLVYTSASHSSQPTNNNRQAQTYAQYDRELLEPDIDIGEYANQAFSSGNTGPQKGVACMGHDDKTDAIFCSFYEVFPKQKWSLFETKIIFFETKIFLFRKHLRNESVFETKVKLFLFLKCFFCFFFKKMAETKFFRMARMGHHTCAEESFHSCKYTQTWIT